jgi:hypothetical protein
LHRRYQAVTNKGNRAIAIRAPESVHKRLALAAEALSKETGFDVKPAAVGLKVIREFLDRLEAEGKIPHIDEDEETAE